MEEAIRFFPHTWRRRVTQERRGRLLHLASPTIEGQRLHVPLSLVDWVVPLRMSAPRDERRCSMHHNESLQRLAPTTPTARGRDGETRLVARGREPLRFVQSLIVRQPKKSVMPFGPTMGNETCHLLARSQTYSPIFRQTPAGTARQRAVPGHAGNHSRLPPACSLLPVATRL